MYFYMYLTLILLNMCKCTVLVHILFIIHVGINESCYSWTLCDIHWVTPGIQLLHHSRHYNLYYKANV